jgi:hypothetical protein
LVAIDKSDPYPGLGRRVLFADVSGKVVCSPKRAAEVPIVIDRSEKAKEALVIAEKEAEPLAVARKRGRPAKEGALTSAERVRALRAKRKVAERED